MDNIDGPPPFIRRGRKDLSDSQMLDIDDKLSRASEVVGFLIAVPVIALIAFALLVRVFG